jgi:purine-binding chemotaxis protein CheW
MNTSEAQLIEEEHFNTDSEQFLTFMLAGEEYGVEILSVQGVQGWTKTTPIPNTPDYILGVINLRGAIVPIIDLRTRFGLETIPYGSTTVVVVVKISSEDSERTVGVVVDGVSEVYRLDNKDIQASPEFGDTVKTEFIKGLATADEKMIILLEINKLISFEEISEVVKKEELH